MNIGNNITNEYLYIYSKKPAIFKPLCSAIDFIIKFGAFPIYVIAPKKTEAIEIAFK